MKSVCLDFAKFESFSRSKSYQKYACFSIFNVKALHSGTFRKCHCNIRCKNYLFSYQVHCSSDKSKYGKSLIKYKCNF